MLSSFFRSREWALWAWGGLVLLGVLIVVEVRVIVWVNGWYRETWDFLQNPDPDVAAAVQDSTAAWGEEVAQTARDNLDKFWGLIGEFCLIVFPFILLRAFNGFFAQHYAFRWRQAITYAYMPLWEKAEKEIEGASQRLQQDPERFARLVEKLGLGFFRSI